MRARWRDPSWRAEADAWIGARLAGLDLARTGEIEQPHVYPCLPCSVSRPTQANVWFKANDHSLRHEAALVELLASRRPDCILKPLASDVESGWMLMPDAGRSSAT